MKLFMNYPVDSGCSYHRILQPGRYCSEIFSPLGHEVRVGEGLPDGYDLYWFHGLPTERGLVEIAKKRRKGGRIIWGVDDDWLSVPDWNPAKPSDDGLAIYDMMIDVAEWIVVSTNYLRSTFMEKGISGSKVMMAPNLVDLSQFRKCAQGKHDVDGVEMDYYEIPQTFPVSIMWAGSATHLEDVDPLIEPLEKILGKYGKDKVICTFMGQSPPPRLMTKYLHRNLFHQPQVPFTSYQNVVNSIPSNIVLAPLKEMEFNCSKSNLRVIEAWGLNTVPVATPWGEYKCIREGVDGRLASTPDEWYSVLDRLINDFEYRVRLTVNGILRVEREYNWNNPECRKPWNRVFGTILGVDQWQMENLT